VQAAAFLPPIFYISSPASPFTSLPATPEEKVNKNELPPATFIRLTVYFLSVTVKKVIAPNRSPAQPDLLRG
jgi:hypothetical protein